MVGAEAWYKSVFGMIKVYEDMCICILRALGWCGWAFMEFWQHICVRWGDRFGRAVSKASRILLHGQTSSSLALASYGMITTHHPNPHLNDQPVV